jgi:signal transduction histidine kinase
MAALHTTRTTSVRTRAAVVLVFNTLIAVLLPRTAEHGFWQNLLYSQFIGLSIWALIDGGKTLVFRKHGGWAGAPRMAAWVVVAVPLGYALGSVAADLLLGYPALRSWRTAPELTLRMLLISLAAGAATAYLFTSREMLARARLAEAQATRQATEARLKLLESQLEPHMLFNTLANLRALIDIDPAAAQRMLDLLNNYLRATLGSSRVAWHPLQDEFARLNNYLELMRVRMGARLQFTLTLPEDLQTIPVPPLLLQPLVENAIVHGLEPTVQGGSLQVRAQRRTDAAGEDWLVLEVRDSGAQLRAGTPGRTSSRFGLTQVRERLTYCYGPQATLELIAEPDHFTLASLQIPLKNA